MVSCFKVVDVISKGGEYFSRLVIFAVMLLICADVVGRYILGAPVDAAIELSEFGMIAIVYLSIAYAQELKLHVKVELFTMHLSARIQNVLGAFSDIIAIAFWSLVVWGSLDSALRAFRIGDTTSGLVRLPLFPAKILIPLGSALLVIQLVFSLWGRFKHLNDGNR